jgi:hypothetical protein
MKNLGRRALAGAGVCRRWMLCLGFAAACSAFTPPAWAVSGGSWLRPMTHLSLFWGRPSAVGGEVQFAFPASLTPEFSVIQAGPRLGLLHAVALDSGNRRSELNPGFEGALWLVNLFGVGAGLDLVVPLSESPATAEVASDRAIRWRGEFFALMRVLRPSFKSDSALSGRFGLQVDSRFGLALELGLSFQWAGVPSIQ